MIDYIDRTGIPLEAGHLNLKFSLADINFLRALPARYTAEAVAKRLNLDKEPQYHVTAEEVVASCRRNGFNIPVSK